MASNKYLTKNVNMNHNEEDPDFLGGLGDMLPADVLKKVNELLERVHRKDKDHQGSTVFIYAPGSQYVDKQFNFGKALTSSQQSIWTWHILSIKVVCNIPCPFLPRICSDIQTLAKARVRSTAN